MTLKKLRQRLGFRIAVIAAIALFWAQLGAMNHAYSHVPQASLATVQRSNPAAHVVCDDCLSFAPALSAAGSLCLLPFTAPPAREIALRAVAASLVSYRLNLAFRSRAPPVTA
jgi:hypothetical protein